jgi:hypothetical protein
MTNIWKVQRDIEIVQGKTWEAKFRYLSRCSSGRKPVAVNLTGYTARMVVRECAEDSALLLDLTTENSGITLGGPNGTIEIEATPTQTSNLTAGDGVYEIELYVGSDVIGFATGKTKVYQEIVR